MTMTDSKAPPEEPKLKPPERKRDDTRMALLFIFPASIGLVVFYFWPLIRGVWLSFTSWDILTPATFIGVQNYIDMVNDPVFWNAARVTVIYVVLNIGIQTVVALVLAVLMQRLTQSILLRSAILAPYLVSNVVAALVFLWILDFQLGIGNQFLEWIGVGRIGFFSDEDWIIPTIAIVNVWRHMGYTALLLFAGLAAIPGHLYEAARMDGASEVRMFFSITLPLLRPILGLVLIISVIGSFQVFDTVSVTTGGGPGDASRVLQMYIYDNAFGQFNFGYAAALSVALLVILMIVTFIQYRVSRAGQTDLN